MMQSLSQMYVTYFNRSYKRAGTLWEGRHYWDSHVNQGLRHSKLQAQLTEHP
jgi:hypothetical protein